MNNEEYLKDSAFLREIDTQRIKDQYVKIVVLNFAEKPIEAIQGRVTGGSLNLDGGSSIRRTCNLSLIATEFENNLTNINYLLSINKKVKLEIGFLNTTNQYTNYEIIWIPLGIYVIVNASNSHALDGVNISLQLKDKMCLLNGECGGLLPASVTFHEYETTNEDGEFVILKPTIFQIIQELVNHFGGEQLSKIIISDIDTRVKQVMKWIGNVPLYMIETGFKSYRFTTAAEKEYYKVFEYGDDIGFIYTDFTYPGELIGDAGNSVCDILDKIKQTLGNYEYFYDVDGNFVFQEIKNYMNTSQTKVELDKLNNEDYLIDRSKGKSVYTFDDSTMVTSYSNSPQYSMIKNDFIVWGIREDALGNTYPIRYHLAIDKKPKTGNIYQCFLYEDPDDKLTKAKSAMEYSKMSNFPRIGVEEVFYMDKSTSKIYEWNPQMKRYDEVSVGLIPIEAKDWRTDLYLAGSVAEPLGIDSNYYYTELKNEWPKLYNIEKGEFLPEVLKYPTDIDFFLDFIDSGAAISELSIYNIGRRTKVINDDSINCVFEPEIPDVVLIETDQGNNGEITEKLRKECEDRGQVFVQVDSNIYSMIATGGHFNSAYNLVRELLFQYTSYNESISVSALPVYYLEPNTRITVRDSQSGIYGDYMINTISIPFDISGTMTLSAVRAMERL